jgi:hypothetical protein
MTPNAWYERQYPEALRDRERELIRRRRVTAGVSEELPVVGAAFSGGGIRSATFVLGFCQGLAQQIADNKPGKPGMLRRIDVMSTVSGGGYFGAFLGALFTRQTTTGEVEARLNDSFSRPIQWLRENGRYLAPNGSGDSVLAGAIVLRNWTAVTVVMSTAMLAAIMGAHLVRISARDLLESFGQGSPTGQALAAAGSVTSPLFIIYWSAYIFPAALVFVFVSVPLGWAYWLGRWWLRNIEHLWVWTTTAVVAALSVFGAFTFPASIYHDALALLAAVVVETLLVASAFSMVTRSSEDDPSGDRSYRNLLSRWMTVSLVVAGAIFALAFVDTLGQTTYVLAWGGAFQQKTLGGVIAAVVSLVAGAQGLPKFLDTGTRSPRVRLPVGILAIVAAAIVSLVLMTALSALSHGVARNWSRPQQDPACTAPAPQATATANLVDLAGCRPPTLPRLNASVTWVATLVLLVVSFFFGRSLPFVNLSSLSQFYSARLSRTYVGASNPQRQTGAGVNLTEEVPGDDLALDRYVPHEKGGPVHLINVTLNETVGGQSQIEDRDRKGLALAIGPSGVSVGVTQHATWRHDGVTSKLEEVETPASAREVEKTYRVWKGSPIEPKRLSLSQWTSISGAAVAPGMGAQTSLGLSLLFGLANVRLGYWWFSGVDPSKQGGTRPKPSVRLQHFVGRIFPVQTSLLREMMAQFHGPHQKLWFLSDGGHFENTACYELLRRRVPIIIVCDDGADPGYAFEDLANLVRKARLDFGAEVRLLEPPLPLFGRPDDVRPKRAVEPGSPALSGHHVIAGQVIYPDAGHLAISESPAPAHSLLIIVKPSLTGDEPLDVLQYAASHPTFPQETTSDQFFDEAQWESYRKLGEHIGAQVNTLAIEELFNALRAEGA